MNRLINTDNVWGLSLRQYLVNQRYIADIDIYGDASKVNGSISGLTDCITNFSGCASNIAVRLSLIPTITNLDDIQDLMKKYNIGGLVIRPISKLAIAHINIKKAPLVIVVSGTITLIELEEKIIAALNPEGD